MSDALNAQARLGVVDLDTRRRKHVAGKHVAKAALERDVVLEVSAAQDERPVRHGAQA